jgi:hypothetical protein
MSHFTCIVTGEDIESALAPFDENLEVEPYRVEIPLDTVGRAIAFYAEHPEHCAFPAPTVADVALAKAGNAESILHCLSSYESETAAQDAEGYYRMSTYNPLSKWDWYAVGGRWRGYFRLTPEAAAVHGRALVGQPGTGESISIRDGKGEFENYEGKADSCLKSEIDFKAMRVEAEHEADLLFDKFAALVPDVALEGFSSWPTFLETVEAKVMTIEAARNDYHSQLAVKLLRDSDDDQMKWASVEPFLVGREAYVASAGRSVAVPYALLHNGEWHERGTMGWFGMSRDDMDEREWESKVISFFEMLPEDTRLTAVDLHI